MKRTWFAGPTLAVVALLAACTERPVTAPESFSVVSGEPVSFMLVGAGNRLPATLAARVAAAGGTLSSVLPEIGVAFATAADPAFATRAGGIPGIQGVAPDRLVQWSDPAPRGADASVELGLDAEVVGDMETFRLMQWAPDAISAPAAWEAGARGAGARVAILDGGIRSTHVDIAPNLDVARSTSFVPGIPFDADVGTLWHGTHVAGIVGAPANGISTVGIAPEATLIGVKVLHGGGGTFEWVMQGLVYAATPLSGGGAGADIINMSLGATFPLAGRDEALLIVALGRATSYAHQQGVTLIASAGNSAIDFDHAANLRHVPSQLPHVIAVAATGPEGFALGATNFDRPASYTNYGRSVVTLAGPGGDFALPGEAPCTLPAIPAGSLTFPCWVFDMVVAPCRGTGPSNSNYCWTAGTSMAAPAVAGVAALVVGKNGRMHPTQLEAVLRRSADQPGRPGR